MSSARNLQFQCPNWLDAFAPLRIELNRASRPHNALLRKAVPGRQHEKTALGRFNSRAGRLELEPHKVLTLLDQIAIPKLSISIASRALEKVTKVTHLLISINSDSRLSHLR